MKDEKCPYCDEWQEINHDDGYGYEEDRVYQQECTSCGKTFVYTTAIILSYNAEKADCLNGADHDWQPTITYPKECTKMYCTMCDEHREPTSEEKERHKIPEFENV